MAKQIDMTTNGTRAKHSKNIILIADDSPTICRLVTTTLERQNYQVVAVNNGLEALAKLNEIRPNLLLVDIMMPHLDGYQLCKIVRANQETKHIPIVMLSGKDGFLDKVKGRMAGATDYITKPFNSDALLQSVAKHIR